jgi:glycosyltransferase involved in cell wall biosynthesis
MPALPETAGRPYVLYVGDRGGYKNFTAVLQALHISTRMNDVQLLCYGGGGMQPEEWALIDGLKLPRNRITHCSGDDSLLAALYANALCLVYPSLYEGFGLPPLEAMNCGCPVVCSTGGSLREVTGQACASFDPADNQALCAALESVVLSESRRTELKAQGHVQAQRFSWDRCAAETLAVYRGFTSPASEPTKGAT